MYFTFTFYFSVEMKIREEEHTIILVVVVGGGGVVSLSP